VARSCCTSNQAVRPCSYVVGVATRSTECTRPYRGRATVAALEALCVKHSGCGAFAYAYVLDWIALLPEYGLFPNGLVGHLEIIRGHGGS
jgi:hypothetical protein